jgi:cell division protein FtsI/penicillin-binding protein 2
VISGSARSLSGLPFTVAGKTGSAQFAENKTTHAWFTSFAPYEKPEIVVTVIIEEGGEGNVVAIPVAREALNWYFNHK